MTQRDDIDLQLEHRLRAYEARLPDGEPPDLRAAGKGRRALVGILAAGAVAGALLAVALLSRPELPVGDASPSPTATMPTPSPSALGWGPLAVVAAGGDMEARNEGSLVITDECVFLERGEERALLVWPADRASWNAGDASITFTTIRGGVVTLRHGDYVVVGGGGSSAGEDGTAGQAWIDSITWVHPPADACLVNGRWFISDVASIGLPSPTPDPGPVAWTRLPTVDGATQFVNVSGVAELNGTLVVVGSAGSPGGAVWVSGDGATWQAAATPAAPSGLGVSLQAPFAVGDRLFVFGITFNPQGSGPIGSVLWTSADGITWSDTPASAQIQNAPLSLVGVSGTTVVAVEGHETPTGSAVWVSNDGTASWQRIAVDPEVGWWAIDGLVHDNTFVAVGTVFDERDETAAIWTSSDGLSWARTELGPGRGIRVVELNDGRLLSISESGDAPAGWTSADGRTWEASDIDLGCCGPEFVVTDAGFVAVQGADDGSGSVVSVSQDGLTWAVAGPLAGQMRGVTWTETFGIVIHGLDPDGRPAVIVGWETD